MYSSSYSRAKFGLEVREPLHKPKGKSCGYYMRLIFFFSSLIQSLIIVSLVLFLIYGQPEKVAVEKRFKDLEFGFNNLSIKNVELRKEKSEIVAQLGARMAEKTALEKELTKLKNDSSYIEQDLRKKYLSCENARMAQQRSVVPPRPVLIPPPSSEVKALQHQNAQQKAWIELIQLNFTQMVQYLSQERDGALREQAQHLEDAIRLRRDNAFMKEQLTVYTRKCKEDFALSLDGIQTVTKAFLDRINNLFPHQMTFHLTCESQMEQMDKIRTSCTNLSREVENKFQVYLDNVGTTVSEIQARSSQQEVMKTQLISELKECNDDRSKITSQAAKDLDSKQKTHDNQMEVLLVEQGKLRDEKNLLESRIALREKEILNLQAMVQSKQSVPPRSSSLPAATPQGR